MIGSNLILAMALAAAILASTSAVAAPTASTAAPTAAGQKPKTYSLDSPEGMAMHRQIQQMQLNQQSFDQAVQKNQATASVSSKTKSKNRTQAKLKSANQKQK